MNWIDTHIPSWVYITLCSPPRHPRHGRVSDSARAKNRIVGAGPHRAQSRGAGVWHYSVAEGHAHVRPGPAAGGWIEVHPERGLSAQGRGPGSVQCRADDYDHRDHRFDRGAAVGRDPAGPIQLHRQRRRQSRTVAVANSARAPRVLDRRIVQRNRRLHRDANVHRRHLPMADSKSLLNLNIGVLYILAVLSLAVYGVVIGGLGEQQQIFPSSAWPAQAHRQHDQPTKSRSGLAVRRRSS